MLLLHIKIIMGRMELRVRIVYKKLNPLRRSIDLVWREFS